MSSTRPTSLIAARAPSVLKVMICATCSRPYFSRDVLDHFAAAVHAEVDVDIGHADALRIQEALEQQPVLQRVDIGDLHRVADQAAGRRTAARTHRNPVRFAYRMKSQTIRK